MTVKGRWLAGIWLALVASCAVVISRTEFTADMSAFLPRSPTPSQKILVDQLRDGVVSRLILIGVDGAPQDALARVSKGMAAQMRKEEMLASVNNGESAGQQKDFDFLWRNRFLLSAAVTPEHYSATALHESLLNYLDLLGSPMGSLAQRALPGDPSGELMAMLEQTEGQSRPSVQDGVWFSADGQRAMLLAQTRAAGYDLDAQERAMQAIQSAFDAARKEAGADQAQLHMTGPGVFSVQSRASIRNDAVRLSTIATLLVSTLLLLLYRSPRALALGLLPVASGALAGVAAVSLGFGSVHGITLGFGVTLIGEGVDYAIYLFTQIAPGDAPRGTLRRIWPTLRLGVLTSICGFSAMLFSGFTGLAQLGLFSIAGLVAAVAVTRWVLPELLPRGFFVRSNGAFMVAAMSAVRGARRARPVLLLAVAALFVFLVLHRDELWDDNLGSLSPVRQEVQAMDGQLRRDMGAPEIRYMVVTMAADRQGALEQSEALAARLRKQVRDGALEGFESPSMYLPSISAQRARQAAIPASATLRENLAQASHGLPFRPGLFAPFLEDASAAKQQALIEPSALHGSNLELKLDALLLKRANGWTAMLPLRGVADAAALARGLELEQRPGAVLLDTRAEAEQMFRDYRHEAARHALLGVAAIILLLALNLRSMRRVFEVSLPLAAAVVAVMAWQVWSGHGLTLFHLIGLLLVVAVGSNYALFFDRQGASLRERERTVVSLLFANVSTVIGFGLLAFSQAPVLNAIGSTVALGTVLTLVFSAALIRRE